MNFLRTAFWVIVAVVLALFTKANWAIAPSYSGYVPVKLWDDIILETRLPVLIVVAFLLGLLPTWLWARACRWRLQRKLTSAERALATSVAPSAFPPETTAAAETAEGLLPPASSSPSTTSPISAPSPDDRTPSIKPGDA
ncbi:MAG: LapA family protein [Sphingobium sp.]